MVNHEEAQRLALVEREPRRRSNWKAIPEDLDKANKGIGRRQANSQPAKGP